MRSDRRLRYFAHAPFLVAALTLAGSLLSADARIGEERERIAGIGGRYGEPTGETTAVLKDSNEKVDVFRKDDISITAEYDADDKVWRLTFQKRDLSEKLIDNLLKKNGGEQKWSKPVTYLDNKHWVTADGKLHAVFYPNPIYKLVIMTSAALKAEHLPQTLEGRETKNTLVEDKGDAATEPKKTEDPLEGF